MRRGPVERIAIALVTTLVVAGALVACSREVTGPTLVLHLATPDAQSAPTGLMVQHFADEVAARSRGTIAVEPVWDVTPNGAVSWDQTVAEGVADGRWDMGLVAGRAWDVLDVQSLRALSTPFLVTSEAALESVLDSDLRGQLLAGLPGAGVTGLDLFPDELRHPFGFSTPVLGPADYAGKTVFAPRSDTTTRILAALGAATTDADTTPTGGATGESAAEGSYAVGRGELATGNVTFFPKTDALVLGNAVRDRLRADQWTVLESAAAQTRHWLFDHGQTDQEAAAAYCDHGGTIVGATADQLTALKASEAPVVSWLRQDPGTRRLIDEIADQVRGIAGTPPTVACPVVPPPSASQAELSSVDGTYVSLVTKGVLRAAGTSDAHLLNENSGRYTWVLHGGTWSSHQEAHHYLQFPDLSGTYTYRNRVLVIHWPGGSNGPDGDTTSMQVRVEPDGTLRFHDIRDSLADQQAISEGQFGPPWTRVGGVPD